MSAKSGAGAAISSGASYQARVGAYIVVTGICETDSPLGHGQQIKSISFETTEAIDDIHVEITGGSRVYIQAKAKIDFSLVSQSDLQSVLVQFERQDRERDGAEDRYFLVTTARSSRKLTHETRAALEAFRLGTEDRFRRDQPKALVEIIDQLLGALTRLRSETKQEGSVEAAKLILRKTSIIGLDLEADAPIEQAMLLVLQSQHYAAPSAVWGKIVSDCLTHSKDRHSVDLRRMKEQYERFKVADGSIAERASDELLSVEFGDLDFSVGREVILGRIPTTSSALLDGVETPSGIVIMEFYRFDENCNERIKFQDGKAILSNGLEISLIRRAATYVGIERMISNDESLVGDEPITICPINSEQNFDEGVCAETQKAVLRRAALENPSPIYCLHCGLAVSSNTASVVEIGGRDSLKVGLTHENCLRPDDRVLGPIRSQFFEENPGLVHFDPNAWFRASHGGQVAFANAERFGSGGVVIAWGGRKHSGNSGQFVVEMILEGGGRETATIRNGVHRFTRSEADAFASRLNKSIQSEESNNPLCYTDQTKAFGTRSFLLPEFGGREKILRIEKAVVQRYDVQVAARYTSPGSWYAPLLFLKNLASGLTFSILGHVPLLTDPLLLGNFLSNWREAGIPVPEYETASILTDGEFDDFMLSLEELSLRAIINPLLMSESSTGFVAGVPVTSVGALMSRRA